ncbi:MAG: glycoside hydrolase family 88 protein [Lachnospiraceae bacterium]|nr:glycoside hydrolase family 88 protein [Lachnospiraceae bacterium]
MKPYFEEGSSITGKSCEVIRTIVNRYMKANPARPFSYRAFSREGFNRDADGRCVLDFAQKFPNAKNGDFAYAFAKFHSRENRTLTLSVTAHNYMELYINGIKITQTNIWDEVVYDKRFVDIPVEEGTNTIFVKCKKTALGFQCKLGSHRNKWDPVNFYTAFAENDGEIGWNYCGPFGEDIIKESPKLNDSMQEFWLPQPYKNRLPKVHSNEEIYAISMILCKEDAEVAISCNVSADMELYVNGSLVASGNNNININLNLLKGEHSLSLRMCNLSGTEFDCTVQGGKLCLPECIKDIRGNWLFLHSKDEKAKLGFDMYTLYDAYEPEQKTFFLCDENTHLRPVLEEDLFGKSNYPVGVVLYGLLKAGEYLNDKEVLTYAHEHLKSCYAAMEYSLWDEKMFGYPCINHQLVGLASLDDCGSFASAVLEDYLYHNADEAVVSFAEYVAEYILNKQERLENGMFYREQPGHLHQNSIWADDLYMSTPFMNRFAKIKGDKDVIDDVVNQFLCFKEKLFMEESGLMSHVYNLTYGLPTRIPWGRGNGWVLFSLSELLMVLPTDHKDYNEILKFFVKISQGFLNQIDDDGMLHQVLWDHESYGEASCTSMCAVAFARGVRMGILPEEPYKLASERCVEALKRYCVDNQGNVYGVCCGSGYSYREEYYKNELPWVLNDTHGTGIVLLAMVEVEKNKEPK